MAARPPKPPLAPTDWRLSLACTPAGLLVRSLDNAALILARDPEWAGVLAWDEFAAGVYKTRKPPCAEYDEPAGGTAAGAWTDEDTLRTALWLARTAPYRLRVDTRVVEQAVRVVARQSARHPVRAYLGGLRWDRVPRLDTWLAEYCGADDTPYTRAVGARALIAAVRRVQRPGCKVDNVLVLEGAQGALKSTAARILGGAWFADTAFDPGQKDAFLALRGFWIIEMGELDRLSKHEAARTKAFVTSAVDSYRPPYGRHVETFPRQCIFIGTCNSAEYLPDTTGNRRWWPVRVTRCDAVALELDRDQLWAEARDRALAGERWWMDPDEERELCAPEQEQRRQRDPWEEPIEAHTRGASVVTTSELLEVLGRRLGDRTRADEMRVAQVLQLLGFRRRQHRHAGKREWFYERPPPLSPSGPNGHRPVGSEVGDRVAEASSGVGGTSPTAPTSAAPVGGSTVYKVLDPLLVGDVGDSGDTGGIGGAARRKLS